MEVEYKRPKQVRIVVKNDVEMLGYVIKLMKILSSCKSGKTDYQHYDFANFSSFHYYRDITNELRYSFSMRIHFDTLGINISSSLSKFSQFD